MKKVELENLNNNLIYNIFCMEIYNKLPIELQSKIHYFIWYFTYSINELYLFTQKFAA
jgi:hypothetical protein